LQLENLGWGASLASSFQAVVQNLSLPSLVPGRVVRQDRRWLRVSLGDRIVLARPSGHLAHHAVGAEALPTIGDWVAVHAPEHAHEAVIHAVLPRQSLLIRRAAGTEHEGQVLAANLDVVFLVSGLDDDLNPRRIERALTVAWESGAQPVVVLNKADLLEDVASTVASIESIAPGVPVVAVSARTGWGMDELLAHLPPGRTGMMLGSSGVGKSSLLNRLLGESRATTSEVSQHESKGRHTTTHRELFLLHHGGLLMDGPGVRELGLWGEDASLDDTFSELHALAEGCRFHDCTHQHEPGCAVRAAVAEGTLSEERLQSYERLRRELAHQERKQNPLARQEEKRHHRARSIAGWEAGQAKRNRK
jgi:ribosome biogenesis GTPase